MDLNGFFCPDGVALSQPLPRWEKDPHGIGKAGSTRSHLYFPILSWGVGKRMAVPGVCLEDRFCFVSFHFSLSSRKKRETKSLHYLLEKFFNLGSINIWGWILVYCEGLSCALQDVKQHPWLFTPSRCQ